MEEKVVILDEGDLDNVVGGAFNPKTVKRLGLDVLQGASGRQGLYVALNFTEGSRRPYTGPTTEDALKETQTAHRDLSVSVRTTSGDMKTLTGKELDELLSK